MKHDLKVLTSLLALSFVSTAAVAQFGNLTPEQQAVMAAKRKKMDAFRENHRNYGRLTRTLFALNDLEKDPKTALTKVQARKVLAIYKAWRTKPSISDDQAKTINKQVGAVLTSEMQIKRVAAATDVTRGGGGFGGGTRPGGGNGGMARAGFDPTKMPDPREYNPLNPDTSPMKAMMSKERFAQMKGRFAGLIAKLEAKAK